MPETHVNPDLLLGAEAAGTYLGFGGNRHPGAGARYLARNGKLGFVRVGAKVLFRRSELDRFIEANTTTAVSTGGEVL